MRSVSFAGIGAFKDFVMRELVLNLKGTDRLQPGIGQLAMSFNSVAVAAVTVASTSSICSLGDHYEHLAMRMSSLVFSGSNDSINSSSRGS